MVARNIQDINTDIANDTSALNWIDGAFNIAPLVPGINSIPGVNVVSQGANFITSGYRGGVESRQIMSDLRGVSGAQSDAEVQGMAGENEFIRDGVNQANNATVKNLGGAATSMATTAAGAAVGTAVLPWGGTIIGGIAGTIIGSYLYDKATDPGEVMALNFAAKVDQARQQEGYKMQRADGLAVMLGSLKKADREMTEQQILKESGAKTVEEGLDILSRDPKKLDLVIRTAETNLRGVKGEIAMNPGVSIVDEYVARVNNNADMPASAMMVNKQDVGKIMQRIDEAKMMRDQGVDVSGMVNPDNRIPPQLANGPMSFKGKFSPSSN